MTTTPGAATRLNEGLALELRDVIIAAAEAGTRASLAAWHRRSELTRDTKDDPDDLVTEADTRTQEAVFGVLGARRPNDRLRGEEAFHPSPARPAPNHAVVEWWVDPIDGTTSFLYGRSDWSVSVAAIDPGTGWILAAAVSEPVLGRLTTAVLGRGAWCDGERLVLGPGCDLARALIEINLGTRAQRTVAGDVITQLAARARDIRRGGSAAVALTALAAGRADAAWIPGLQTWDGAAGMLIASESGATVGDLHGATGPRWPTSGDVLAAPAPLFGELRELLTPIYATAEVQTGPRTATSW
jgi:myo-inositol-1(or 4)-monophosphatase